MTKHQKVSARISDIYRVIEKVTSGDTRLQLQGQIAALQWVLREVMPFDEERDL